MLSFWFRKNKITEPSGKLKPMYEGDRGLADLYANDAELRVWAPEPLKAAMEEATKHLETTLSQYLRELLVVYLYGMHELMCMRANRTGIHHLPPPPPNNSQTLYSRSRMVECIPGLGKNIMPLKLFLHQKMKDDLQVLADKASIPLSQFVRELLVSHFLGYTVWPERHPKCTHEQQAIADAWAHGDIDATLIRNPTDEEKAALEGVVETGRW